MSPQAPGIRKFEALAAACCDPRLARGDLAVLAVILQHASSTTGAAWPGVNRIAQAAKLHRSNVILSIKRLEGHGFLAVERGVHPRFHGHLREGRSRP